MTVPRTEPAQATEPLWGIDAVSEYLGGITRDAIYMQRWRNDLPGALGFKVGRRLMFDPAEVRAYVATQKATTRAANVVVNFEDRASS